MKVLRKFIYGSEFMIFNSLILIINLFLSAYLTVLFIRAILDWIPIVFHSFRPNAIVRKFAQIIYYLTEPLLRFARRFIPPARLGNISLDVSFMVVYFLIIVLQMLLSMIY